MNNSTSVAYCDIVSKCKEIFLKKNQDYGMSWTILRLSSLTDQIFIKAKRIRNLQETDVNLVGDSQEDEFYGIINYCIMAMMIYESSQSDLENLTLETLEKSYVSQIDATYDLMIKKNTDYGEVWRDMRVSSMTDMILTKLLRIKQIEDNQGKVSVSEGVYSNYQDIMNYCIFSIILIQENH